MNYNDIKTNDLVSFIYHTGKYNACHKKGIVLSNDSKRKIITIKWFYFMYWGLTAIKYNKLESLDFSKIGVSKYETIYKPAFFGMSSIYVLWLLFGSFITGIIQIESLVFGGGLVFILVKNFKRILNGLQTNKNVTIFYPVDKDPVVKSQPDDSWLTMVQLEKRRGKELLRTTAKTKEMLNEG